MIGYNYPRKLKVRGEKNPLFIEWCVKPIKGLPSRVLRFAADYYKGSPFVFSSLTTLQNLVCIWLPFERWCLKVKKLLKLTGIGCLVFGLVIVLAAFKYGAIEEPSQEVAIQDVPDSSVNEVTTDNKQQEVVQEKLEVENKEIAVTSQIVKKVDGKCRYFFDIRNNDTSDFEGTVEIQLLNTEGAVRGKETFNTNSAIKPTLGSSVFYDINTCPSSVTGELGISTYTFKVQVNKDIVAEGVGTISDKYEVL